MAQKTVVLCLILILVLVNYCASLFLSNQTLSEQSLESGDTCFMKKYDEEAVWGPILEEWAIMGRREKRVMHFSSPIEMSIGSSPNIIEVAPPKNHNRSSQNEETLNYVTEGKVSTLAAKVPEKYSPPAKIVNGGTPSVVNNNKNKPPPRQVTETELYILSAIEKLVYKMDFMEKRLRKVEEAMYFVMAGNRIDTEPCAHNFTRIGHNCYHFGSNAGRELDWKMANKMCRKHSSTLVEFESNPEIEDVVAYIQSNSLLRGKDFWTGGLNPGLLWIWSGTARPVITHDKNTNKPNTHITGDGRCLRLAYDPALRKYFYKGTDCSVRFNFICELTEDASSNQLRRLGRIKNIFTYDP